MNPLNQLSTLAYKIANDFVSSANSQFLFLVNTLVKDPTGVFEIDLLKERISPSSLVGGSTDQVIKKYRNLLMNELDVIQVSSAEVEKAAIKVTFKPGPAARIYTCNVTIKAGGKEYVKQASTA
ncbi:MAG: hypothetical protein V1702_03450 [Candidatus Woesearchaeota archaeon]